MKRSFLTFCTTLLLLAMAMPSVTWASTGTDKAINQTGTIIGTCYTIDESFVAGGFSGTYSYGSMGSGGGVKLRTNTDGDRIVFNVTAPFTITKFTMEAYSNNTDAIIRATKVEVDGVETSFTGGSFPSKTTAQNSNESGNLTISGISATESIVIYFDNSEVTGNKTENTGNKNKQILAYYELEWGKKHEQEPSSLSFESTSGTADLSESTSYVLPQLTKQPSDITVSYASSNTAVAVVDSSTGAITLMGKGTATITATFAGNETYAPSTAEFKLTVMNRKDKLVGYTEHIVDKTLMARTLICDNENVSVSDLFYGTNIDNRIGVSKTVYINGEEYTSTDSWRKNVNNIYDNQNIGYTLTVAKGHKMNISNVSALIAVTNLVTFKWYVEILDGSNKQLWKSDEHTASAMTSEPIDNVDVSEIEALQGLTGNITVNLYVRQEGSDKSFSINYLLLTIDTETDNRPTYDMTVSQNIAEAGTVTPATGSWAAEGESVAFIATPNVDYKFIKWTVDGTNYFTNPYLIENVTANHSAQATFKKRYTVTYDLGDYVGSSSNILNNVNRSLGYDEKYSDDQDNYIIPHYAHMNLYREGYVFDKWRDNNGRTYASGDVIAMTDNITLTPTWKATTESLKESQSETIVTWSFDKKDILFCTLNTTKYNYYTQNVSVNGETIALPMKMSGRKVFNSNNDVACQISQGVTFTIPAVSGMVVELSEGYLFQPFSTTTIAGSTNYTKSDDGRTIAYTYTGDDETIEIVINEEMHVFFKYVKVYYPTSSSNTGTEEPIVDEGISEGKLWDFTQGLSAETIANMNADTENWESNGTDAGGNTNNWKNVTNQGALSYWTANGTRIEELNGLKFDIGTNTANSVHLATTKLRLTRANTVITFPKLKNGQKIKISGRSANTTTTNRGIAPVQSYLQFLPDKSSPQTDGTCIFLGSTVEGSEDLYTFVWEVVTESTDYVDVQFQLNTGGIDFTRFEITSANDATADDIETMDNAIYIEPLEGRLGGDMNIEIKLKNAEAATAYVFDLVLPEGITVAQNENGKYIDVLSDRHAGHSRTFNYRGNNTYSLSTLSGNSEELTGNDGAIRILTLAVADNLPTGNYTVEIKNASYSTPTGKNVTLPDTKAIITVDDYVLGDVNGNGGVDIGDAVTIVNYLVGKPSETFIEKAADTNKNGKVDIGDAVTIVNFLVGKTTSLSRSIGIEEDEKEPQ